MNQIAKTVAIVTNRARSRGRLPSVTPAVQPVATPVQAVTPVAGHNNPPGEITPLQEALNKFAAANFKANAEKRAADKAQKELAKAMADANVKRVVSNAAMPDGSTVPMVAEIASKEDTYISVEKLRTLVSDEVFMKIVSATKTAVTEIAGTNVALQAEATRTKPESLSVRKLDA